MEIRIGFPEEGKRINALTEKIAKN